MRVAMPHRRRAHELSADVTDRGPSTPLTDFSEQLGGGRDDVLRRRDIFPGNGINHRCSVRSLGHPRLLLL
jgi:hypothetical protein